MSRAKGSAGPEKLLRAAAQLGMTRGIGALSLQGIATAAGVSKALVLYHFGGKGPLLRALAVQLATDSQAELQRAAAHAEPLEAWRTLARDPTSRSTRALLAALLHEEEVRDRASDLTAVREGAATELGLAMFRSLGLLPMVAPRLLGSVMLHLLDGLAASPARHESALDAELDAAALALLALAD